MIDKKINSITELITRLKADIPGSIASTWFRGHADASWALCASYHRLKNPPPEIQLVNKFRQNANYLMDGAIPRNDFEWLFLMQHYGVPTRLLDWSESPLVAMFFAVCDPLPKHKNKDAALWLLFPGRLNEQTNAKKSDYIPAFEEKEYMESYTTDKYDKGNDILNPMAAIATRNNPRIQAQSGVFTISHKGAHDIELIGNKSHIKKYIIPKEKRLLLLLS